MNVGVLLILFYLFILKWSCCETEEYDFIVIGGGLAGCIVASRLSELSQFTVLLLEAGSEPPLISQVPMLAPILENSKYDWNYTTLPQKNAANRSFEIIRGKMLGGCGSFNSLFWLRGNKRDYDIWASKGVEGWNWDKVLPYFKKVETDISNDANIMFSGLNGPIVITNDSKNVTLLSKFLEEMQKRGYKYKDSGDGNQQGYSFIRLNVNGNRRQSTYTNYLKPAMSRRNLKVIKNALVTKILFNQRKEAIGVVYEKLFHTFQVLAKREVVVAAGAINTPQLLMLSGIGPKEHLKALNIDVISDLPVGNNLQNHLRLSTRFWKKLGNVYTPESLKQFFEGYGPLTNYSAVSSFINSDISSDLDFPDIQQLIAGQFVYLNPAILTYVMLFYIQRPKSVGTIRLQSANPKQYPLIDPNYLRDEYDMKVLTYLTKQLKNISEAVNVHQHEYSMSKLDDSQCVSFGNNSDEYWQCTVKANVEAACHYCCTCQMGSAQNSTAVVDSELNVLGVKKLRIIDASVMPTIPSSNIQAVVAMIVEKGSDLIKKSHARNNKNC